MSPPARSAHAHLDDLASGCAEIVPLQVDSIGSRLLGLRRGRRRTGYDDRHRYPILSSAFM
jgi:hypothetical protein